MLTKGKTTVMRHLLEKKGNKNFGSIIIGSKAEGKRFDAESLLTHTEENAVYITPSDRNWRDTLYQEVLRLSSQNSYDHLFIESGGTLEPMSVAEILLYANNSTLEDYTDLVSMITVIDGTRFLNEMDDAEDLEARGLQTSEDDMRSVVHVLVQQLEFANIILLNKCDLVSAKDILKIKQYIRSVNDEACIIETINGRFSKIYPDQT